MENEWEGFYKLRIHKCFEKVDTSYAKEDLAIVANAVGNLPTDKKKIHQ
jgi:hypothetical protein